MNGKFWKGFGVSILLYIASYVSALILWVIATLIVFSSENNHLMMLMIMVMFYCFFYFPVVSSLFFALYQYLVIRKSKNEEFRKGVVKGYWLLLINLAVLIYACTPYHFRWVEKSIRQFGSNLP